VALTPCRRNVCRRLAGWAAFGRSRTVLPPDRTSRFAPGETGRWIYAWVLTNRSGARAVGSGAFDCVKGRVPRHGFLRPNPGDPFHWVFEDGTPYCPIGPQECIHDAAGG
jgi:hypothetical protein